MTSTIMAASLTQTNLQLVLSEIRPASIDSLTQDTEATESLDAFLAFDDGGLAEAPHALAAYVTHQQTYAQ